MDRREAKTGTEIKTEEIEIYSNKCVHSTVAGLYKPQPRNPKARN